ncbi:MAG: sugar ABC transporter permease [Ruminococcus flavefaciens]|nr:sugar ABC transporter permease [Ruminococcus flavefaciens]
MQQKKMSRALQRRENISGYLFMLPSLVFFVGFVVLPMFLCVIMSLTDAGMMDKSGIGRFVGLRNFIAIWKDSTFLEALKNTFLIVVVSVPVVCAFSLWVSSVIYKMKGPVLSAFRCIFYLPVVTGSVAVTVVWKWMFSNYGGIFNQVLTGVGVIDKNINWLGDEKYALWCIILILLTTSVGQPIVLYVSALGNVDKSLEEAAQVDGATDVQVFWRVKWAQMMPTTLYILVITTINSFQCFALIQLLTSGGSGTNTVMYYIYYTAFKLTETQGHFGYANAMGVMLAIFIGLLSALQFKLAAEK